MYKIIYTFALALAQVHPKNTSQIVNTSKEFFFSPFYLYFVYREVLCEVCLDLFLR